MGLRMYEAEWAVGSAGARARGTVGSPMWQDTGTCPSILMDAWRIDHGIL